MKIGMVTACYKPVVNGVTRMVALYKAHLEAMGHQVFVFTLGEPAPGGDEEGVIRSPAIPLGDRGYYVSIRYSERAQRLMQEMDIIHCHHLFMSVELAHRYAHAPIVYTNHTRYDLYTGSIISLPQPAADAIMRQIWPELTDLADVVITPSESVRKVMLDFGVRQPMRVIPNGIDLRPFFSPLQPFTKTDLGLNDDDLLLAYVGRLSPEKNLDRLLRQVAIARDIVPNLHLLIVGSGPHLQALTSFAQALHLRDAVHFTGAVQYEDVSNYLAAADIFATASDSEVHPLTVIEAMAAALPVIGPASPGIVDSIEHGKSGLLTHRPDGGLAAAIVGLALDSARRRQMGRFAQEVSKKYDIQETVAQTVALYESLRETRPDLQRNKGHGSAIRNRERWQPLFEQLARIIRPNDKQEPLLIKDKNGTG